MHTDSHRWTLSLLNSILPIVSILVNSPSVSRHKKFSDKQTQAWNYWRLVGLGLCLGLAFGLDWAWGSWLFIFLVYLKGRKWLPIHKVVGHSLFWLGYGLGASALLGSCWVLQGSLWLRLNQVQPNFWLWLFLSVGLLIFFADGLNRLRRQNPAYWQSVQHELVLTALLLVSIIAASYFEFGRFVAVIPALLVCYRPVSENFFHHRRSRAITKVHRDY